MLGKWNNDHIVKSYVNGIPINACLSRGSHTNLVHLLPRMTVEPDQVLLDCIFPGVEQRLEKKLQVS